jgi:hypothetical protein
MKNLRRVVLIVLGFSFSSCGGMFSSLSAEAESKVAGVVSILPAPYRTVYSVGAIFEKEDLRVYAVFADGKTRNITDEVTVVPAFGTVFAVNGMRVIRVEYRSQTAEYTVVAGSIGSDGEVVDPGSGSGNGESPGLGGIVWADDGKPVF